MGYFVVGSESQPDVLTINREPAVLFPGLQLLADLSGTVQKWNPSRGKFDNRDPEAFFLFWEDSERTFNIAVKSPTISKKDMIRLAESIP